MIDWDAIRAEYIAGGVSQRDLAAEHGVSAGAVRDRCKSEGWVAQRREAAAKTAQKMTESITNAKIKKIEKIVDQLLTQTQIAARQLGKMPKIEQIREELDDGTVRVTVRREYTDAKGVDRAGLRLLSQTVKDLDEVLRRQRADARGGSDDRTIQVVFGSSDEEDYSI